MKNDFDDLRKSDNQSRFGNWDSLIENSEVEILNMDMDKEVYEKVLRITLRTIIAQKEVLNNCDEDTETKAFMSMAKAIKSNLAIAVRKENPWQVVIGRSYGTFVTHEAKYFLFFKYAGLWITLFVSN